METLAVIATRDKIQENLYLEARAKLEAAGIKAARLVHGGSGAAKYYAERLAKETGAAVVEIAADWEKYGKAAGPIRGKQIIESAGAVLAIWDGKSKGTAAELQHARKLRKRTLLILAD